MCISGRIVNTGARLGLIAAPRKVGEQFHHRAEGRGPQGALADDLIQLLIRRQQCKAGQHREMHQAIHTTAAKYRDSKPYADWLMAGH
jgi:hypothetical protein